ncbi:MAG: phosphatidate cytidylyltransferase [Gammaproteobacteria bacterium]|nr:phosphatidate cytidylyltransferase [Gammaproteobacteria bacterium]MBS03237.1 phosphatidate cytidylyltransferase [Gammaproteobacteria bacterium]
MLRQRILTALVMAPVAIGGIFVLPPELFALFTGAVLAVAAWEWANLANLEGGIQVAYAAAVVVGFALAHQATPWLTLLPALAWWLFAAVSVLTYPASRRWSRAVAARAAIGFLLLVPGYVAMVELKAHAESTFLILLLFFLIWAADIGAYFAGRAFGKRKLAPKVSPGKSWAGAFGGMFAAVGVGVGMLAWRGTPALTDPAALLYLGCCLAIAIVSVFGDLTISLFKRERGVKDTSNLLPGHGGFLDRIDSLLSAAPLFAVFLMLGAFA